MVATVGISFGAGLVAGAAERAEAVADSGRCGVSLANVAFVTFGVLAIVFGVGFLGVSDAGGSVMIVTDLSWLELAESATPPTSFFTKVASEALLLPRSATGGGAAKPPSALATAGESAAAG